MVCKQCGSDKLTPITWKDVDGKDYWDVYCRCGDCRCAYWKLMDQEDADAWDEILQEQEMFIKEALRDLETTDVLTTEAFDYQ